MLFSMTQQSTPVLVADQSAASALRAVLSYHSALAPAALDVRVEGHAIIIDGTVQSERERLKLLEIVHDFTAIPIICLVSVRSPSIGLS